MDNARNSQEPNDEHSNNAAAQLRQPTIKYIEQYIDASAKSADRARFVLIVLITASVLSFFAYWNSSPSGWLNSRLIVASDALKFYDEHDDKGKAIYRDEESFDNVVWPRFFSLQTYNKETDAKKKQEYLNQHWPAFDRARKFVRSSFVQQSRFADLEHLRRYIEGLERMRTERVLSITVPFFGIVFDLNDLGVFAGITFVIVLLLFRFSLLRELRNLRLVFRQVHSVEDLRLCYDMLSMQQVLTIPPQIERYQSERNFWSIPNLQELFWQYVPSLLILLPLLVHLNIFITDYQTYPMAEEIYPGTVYSLWANGILLGLNVLLTLLCIYLGWKVGRTWHNHAKYIWEHSNGESLQIQGEPPPALPEGEPLQRV